MGIYRLSPFRLYRTGPFGPHSTWSYMVPAIRVLMCVFLSSYSFANPKSDIFGHRSLSSKILLALTSLCTIFGLDSSGR